MSQVDDPTPVMPGGGGGHGFVKPRASFEPGGAALPLVKLIEQHVGKKGIVYVLGGTGSGKTWAVHHLRTALGADARVALFDEPGDPYWELEGLAPLVVIATSHGDQPNSRCVLHLSRWTDDDLIEFLLTGGHRAQVASVMKRVRADEGRGALLGNPRLWRIVLEEMLADERITRCAAALGKRLAGLEGSVRQSASTMALAAVRSDGIVKTDELPGDIAKLVRHPIVCELLAAERIVSDLECHQGARHLERSLPPQLVRQTGLLVRERLGAWRALATLLSGHYPQTDAMAASIMLAANPAWYPTVSRRMVLSGAMLAGALWSGVQLAEADLSLADLAGEDLSRARLDRVRANGVDLSRANLAAATLTGAGAAQADFIDADLTAVVAHKATFSGADFTGAVLARADLLKAILCQCEMKGADLREAILRGADLSSARLEEADFTGADLTEVEMDGTDLSVAVWGATRFRRAKLRRCNLEGSISPASSSARRICETRI